MLRIYLLVLSLTSLACYSQDYNYATYTIHIEYDESSKTFTPEVQRSFDRIIDATNNLRLEVLTDNAYSLTRIMNALSADSRDIKPGDGVLIYGVGLGHTEYVDIKKQTYFVEKGGEGVPKHLVKYGDSLPEWEISSEIKTPNNTQLRKATTIYNGYSIIAWFDATKPQSIGPSYYNGLPGIVTELYIEPFNSPKVFTYSFLLSELKYKEIEVFTVPPEDLKILTFEESEDLFRGDFEKFKSNN